MSIVNSIENFFFIMLLIVLAIVGDYIVGHSNTKIFSALSDNLTHGVIGGLSWFIVCFNCKRYIWSTFFEIFLCALLASAIDLDHFLAAKSFKLKDAMDLSHRPILHCSTIPLVLSLFLLTLAYWIHSRTTLVSCLIVFVAFGSHHTRDATRRGYWFFPYGSTSPIPYPFYILITVIIPYLVCFIFKSSISNEKLNLQSSQFNI